MAYAFQIGPNASMERLEDLIEKRLEPNANKEAIDQRIWNLFGEEWAIMFTDLSGFSRHVAEFGIIHFLQVIYESQRVLVPIIDEHDGILLKLEGDSMLVMFRSVIRALECSISMQRKLAEYNNNKPDTEKILLSVGLGYGPVLRIGDLDVFGAEVNAASKLGEDTAEAWEILVTDNVCKELKGMKDIKFKPIEKVPPGADIAYKVEYKLK
jgi:class 3 adenylate cyclase